VLCCKDLVGFAASGFLVLGQDALLLKAGLTPPCSGSVAQLTARETAARSGPRFAPPLGFLLLAGYENLTAPLFALSDNAKLKWQLLLPGVLQSAERWIVVP
jgi:hypothetical protein